jgi:glycosyltransferase involved in cell wall biosynthesis
MPEVTHVSPKLFGPRGIFGGGERYPLELARAMARLVPTRLLSFGPEAAAFTYEDLEIRILPSKRNWKGSEVNPVSGRLAYELAGSRIVHAHHWESVVTNLCLVAGATLRKRVYATDLGGSGPNYWRKFRLHRLLSGFLAVSQFAASFYPELVDRSSVISGGVDLARHQPGPRHRTRRALFVGRLLPHKGIDVLIEALAPQTPLHVMGRPYDPAFRERLQRLAAGKSVTFDEAATDDDVVVAYQTSRVLVLPSTYEPVHGPPAPKAELLGLTLLEAMACGTPAVCTNVGGMPEVVSHGETGLVVPTGDARELADAVEGLLEENGTWRSMSEAAATDAHSRFGWNHVAQRCLAAYGGRP